MDTTQFLLSIILTVTTILLVIVGIQLIFVLRELRKIIKKTREFIDDLKKEEEPIKKDGHPKKHLVDRKHTSFYSILEKIKILSPPSESKTKKFVKSI